MSAPLLNKDVFFKDPTQQRLANQGVAKLQAPTPPERMATLRDELENFVCDGHYAEGLEKILTVFLANLGKGTTPAVWISGFFGSGKSHLAAMLAALWENVEFEDGARADGLVGDLPPSVKAALAELRSVAKRHGGLLAAGGSMPEESADPGAVVLGLIFRAVGLPQDLRSARIALWLENQGIRRAVMERLGEGFSEALETATLSPQLSEAILAAKPEIAADARELRGELKHIFGDKTPVTPEQVEEFAKRALRLGRETIPLTLLVLDEVQQFLKADPGQTLKIQNLAERLSSAFDGKVMVVATGQQALSDLDNLQKLLGRFSVSVILGDTDIDTVIRRTVLRKDPKREPDVRGMLNKFSGEIARQLHGSPFAHTMNDDADAVADWPLLPARRRVWKAILAEMDASGLTGNLRGQLHTTLAAAQAFADRPLGHAVVTDFLYERVGDDAFNLQMITRETRDAIEELRKGGGDNPAKARLLMLIYMLGRIAETADRHGLRARTETLADLMIEDLAGEPELRGKLPDLLRALADDGKVVEVEGGEWRLQTKESAQWQIAFREEKRRLAADPAPVSSLRAAGLSEALETALAGASQIAQGQSKTTRKVHRLRADEEAPKDGVPLRVRPGYTNDLAAVEAAIKGASTDDATLYLLISRHEPDALKEAIETRVAAERVLADRGPGGTGDAGEARRAMEQKQRQAQQNAKALLTAAVAGARVLQAGGATVSGSTLAEAVKSAALLSAARLYPRFDDADSSGWATALNQAERKQPDALKAVNHSGEPETHPVAKAILAQTGGGGKTGRELRTLFMAPPYGWPQDAVDSILLILTTAGRLKARGEDGNPADPATQGRSKLPATRFQTEAVVATAGQKIAVRALLQHAGVPFENNAEGAALPVLIGILEQATASAGGDPPAPPPPIDPELTALKTLSGAERLVALADAKDAWLAKLLAWRGAKSGINERLPAWRLAERLVRHGAEAQAVSLEAVRTNRALLNDPDPVGPLISEAAESLRSRLNTVWSKWETAWTAGETRLANDALWARLSPEQRLQIRSETGLRAAEQPDVNSPNAIADVLDRRSLDAWDDAAKALNGRVGDALREAAAELEPQSQDVILIGGLLRTEAELDDWLKSVRALLVEKLTLGPVIPRI